MLMLSCVVIELMQKELPGDAGISERMLDFMVPPRPKRVI